ncbi:glutathione S-transferase [Massilia sp. KIM]|uniref:glutathione S-transferase family protein n=1 Tax=Massilia sp. KIM TaxID=1955422 RepID=UPI00098F0847|nr:glutathione S-transferase N-terminal domain-containing protein [Massilia sp. KIM]OON61117.1 glutathione S-transferase [Massilia sp. KIM]
MYALYYSPGTASMVIHALLRETGAPFTLQPVDFERKAQHGADYLRLNPAGMVPTLIVDGAPVQESAALILLLAERHPEAQLAPPPGDPSRADWLKWTVHLSSHLGALYRTWFYPGDLGLDDYPDAMRDALRARIEAVFEYIEQHLAAHGPYLLGERFSSADLQLTMYMRWSRKMPRPATTWPRLNALAHRVTARASWTAMCEAEGLADWAPAPL